MLNGMNFAAEFLVSCKKGLNPASTHPGFGQVNFG
jgi:hypothetical protein